jgi:hypothetical protein
MEPTRDDDAVVELVDVLLRDGAVIGADVVVTVADVPLVGISLRAAVAGMTTMSEYGVLDDWDDRLRERAAGRHDDDAADAGGPSATGAAPGRPVDDDAADAGGPSGADSTGGGHDGDRGTRGG